MCFLLDMLKPLETRMCISTLYELTVGNADVFGIACRNACVFLIP
jgi:hypothetical protein